MHPLPRRRLLAGLFVSAAAGCARQPDVPPVSVTFFTSASTELDPPARSVIAQFAADAKSAPSRQVIVRGYAERLSQPGNQALADRRAQAVVDTLVSMGVDRSRISIRPREPTGADPGVESRRVELSFGH